MWVGPRACFGILLISLSPGCPKCPRCPKLSEGVRSGPKCPIRAQEYAPATVLRRSDFRTSQLGVQREGALRGTRGPSERASERGKGPLTDSLRIRSGQVLPRSLAVPARRPVRLSTRTDRAPQLQTYTEASIRATRGIKAHEEKRRGRPRTHERAAGRLVRSPRSGRPPM